MTGCFVTLALNDECQKIKLDIARDKYQDLLLIVIGSESLMSRLVRRLKARGDLFSEQCIMLLA